MKNDLRCWDSVEKFEDYVQSDSPYKVGSLVSARMGYFMPNQDRLAIEIENLVTSYCTENHCSDQRIKMINFLSHRDKFVHKRIDADLEDFFRWCEALPSAAHPYGIILGRARENTAYSGRELYRVNFGGTIYEQVHPVQLEVIGEV